MSNSMPVSPARVQPLVSVSAPHRAGFLGETWVRWKKIARAIGVVQTRIMMVVFYFIFVLPLGLVLRLSGDPLRLRGREGSNWVPHRHDASLEAARRQF
jgi:hypothetical protein